MSERSPSRGLPDPPVADRVTSEEDDDQRATSGTATDSGPAATCGNAHGRTTPDHSGTTEPVVSAVPIRPSPLGPGTRSPSSPPRTVRAGAGPRTPSTGGAHPAS